MDLKIHAELTVFSSEIIFTAHISYNEEVTVMRCECIYSCPNLFEAVWRKKRTLLNKRQVTGAGGLA